ncbi:MAG: molybdopterin molybdotransferase MoeA, partial [Acidimicrobiia bacterium]|nr:molybdopterin molybdotransferase MoeA [Acidimicrobiia bacterium]
MHTPDTAARTILNHLSPLPPMRVAVAETVGCVLAEPVVSRIAVPHWDNSAMDGYALRTADLEAGRRDFTITETIPAGDFPQRVVESGQCARIFTGAPVPDGADCVIRQEDVTARGDSVHIDDTRDAGRNIRQRGEDIAEGDEVFAAGTAVTPARLGVLVSLAHDPVTVHRRPRVAILTSGDEIADLDERDEILAGRKVATSNTYTLTALIAAAGAEVTNLGIARDDPDDVKRRLESARDADLIVTSAGISVGDHDHLHEVLDALD